MRRLLGGLVVVAVLIGGGYTAYSGWYSWQRFSSPPTPEQVCVDGVPVASAAGIEDLQRRFRWQWAPIPFTDLLPTSLDDIPAADIIKTRLPKRPAADRVIIQFTDASSFAERRNYVRAIGGVLERSLSRIDTYVVTFDGSAPANIPTSSIVVNIERDTFAAVTATNDTFYDSQWALPYLGVEDIWLQLPEDAEPITVAVVDSGICADHPDLDGVLVTGWDFVEDDNSPDDEMGHGCGVAGVIAAIPNNGIGVAGVSPVVEVMPLRVLDKFGVGTQSNIAAAIVFAADRRVDIINLSLASPNPSQTVEDAVNYAIGKGVTVIAAAGNNGSEGAWYPAALPNVISVGAIDQSEERSSFSNFGANVDIYAPGRNIYTTSVTNNYQTMTGTSFAAPLVSGLTALDMAVTGSDNTNEEEIARPPVASETCE
jgi:thermitase